MHRIIIYIIEVSTAKSIVHCLLFDRNLDEKVAPFAIIKVEDRNEG
jgi:hypothetical protein